MFWIKLHRLAHIDMLGIIPEFFDEADPRPVEEQIDENYQHGGGWYPYKGFTLAPDATPSELHSMKLQAPDDPDLVPLFATICHKELVIVYESGWTAIFQPDLSFTVARLD
jgi:hypothetical protein